MIKASYDPEADAMFIWLAPEGVKSVETREVEPGILLDFGGDGRLAGIEALDVRRRVMAYPDDAALTGSNPAAPSHKVFLARWPGKHRCDTR